MKEAPDGAAGSRECPSCACRVALNHNRCPICAYEFPVLRATRLRVRRLVALLLLALLLILALGLTGR